MGVNIEEFNVGLRQLLRKHKVNIGVDLSVDTHGVYSNFVVFGLDGKREVIGSCTSYLDASDLEDDSYSNPKVSLC